jgi:spectinomycin phosphotransferase
MALVERFERLGRRLSAVNPAAVLCHTDIHGYNLIVTADGCFFIIDWDDAMLAPRERDLMFVLDGAAWRPAHSPAGAERLFQEGYGPVAVDEAALAYYRSLRAIEDIGDFAERVFLRPDLGDAAREEAAALFLASFGPDQSVEVASRTLV